MQIGIEIRRAGPDDAQAACDLLRRAIAEGCEPDHRDRAGVLDAWLGNKTPANVASWFTTPSNYAVVAVRGGQLLGLALLTQAGKVALCYVLPEAIRSGVGRALLGAVEEQARAWCVSKLHLHSPGSAAGFFERHGYANAGKEKACFGLECDFMWKSLKLDAACEVGARKRFCKCSDE